MRLTSRPALSGSSWEIVELVCLISLHTVITSLLSASARAYQSLSDLPVGPRICYASGLLKTDLLFILLELTSRRGLARLGAVRPMKKDVEEEPTHQRLKMTKEH